LSAWFNVPGEVFEIKGRPQSAINHLIPKQQQRPSLIVKVNCALSSTLSSLTLISFTNETLATNSIIFVVLANSFDTPTSRFLNWIFDSSATPFLSNNNVRPTWRYGRSWTNPHIPKVTLWFLATVIILCTDVPSLFDSFHKVIASLLALTRCRCNDMGRSKSIYTHRLHACFCTGKLILLMTDHSSNGSQALWYLGRIPGFLRKKSP